MDIDDIKKTKRFLFELDEILAKYELDLRHDKKRILAFCILDAMIDKCLTAKGCPNIEECYHRYLIDISVDSYVKQKAYFFALDGIGADDNDRFFLAKTRVDTIINCPRNCRLKRDLFVEKTREIMSNPRVYVGIRNRKAFWNFLRYKDSNDPIKDYEGACSVVHNVHEAFLESEKNNRSVGRKLAVNIRDFVSSNMHIINGFELFQVCLFKRPGM